MLTKLFMSTCAIFIFCGVGNAVLAENHERVLISKMPELARDFESFYVADEVEVYIKDYVLHPPVGATFVVDPVGLVGYGLRIECIHNNGTYAAYPVARGLIQAQRVAMMKYFQFVDCDREYRKLKSV